MAKIIGPLNSLNASGSFGERLVFSQRKSGQQARFQKAQKDKITINRTSQRLKYTIARGIWNNLDSETKQSFDILAYSQKMTGYNMFMKLYLLGLAVDLITTDDTYYYGFCYFGAGIYGSGGFIKPIRICYIVPSDYSLNSAYVTALEKAVEDLQIWWKAHTGNDKTFWLNGLIVEVFYSSHNSEWYHTNPNGGDPQWYYWLNGLYDGFALTGGQFNDPENRWLFYIDAPNYGGGTGAASGVALFPQSDLIGLASESVPGRWVGGMGHEYGHTLGLPHPAGSPGGPDDWALMYLGYSIYPYTYFTDADKVILSTSNFIQNSM